MFQLMRNTHLVLGVTFVLFAVMFAVSSLKIVYRTWFPDAPVDREDVVSVAPDTAANPRALALELMASHGLSGDLRRAEEKDGEIRLTIGRPGAVSDVVYTAATSEAVIKTRRMDLGQFLVQLHVNHGLHHDFWPSQVWSALTFLTSIALFVLGGTGIYLWFSFHKERVIGGAILAVGLAWGLTTLYLCRV